ncbi:hypothetical protein PL9631_440049 [Planktothrix paucivesiculata PCC 9631]|uniref:Uncharacterized protein n=1 Tax=Planktothrix paucivesiculata PCC 9631 TaxID=671071 RepID=A0A7Z9BV32_9CYAN|nr:hypothetical protein PL9631_440049 [Planktothrix paucivesiculata PCC 9631]
MRREHLLALKGLLQYFTPLSPKGLTTALDFKKMFKIQSLEL